MAFDGGAGIGRVTKNLLLKNFEKVEMLDPIENFIDNAKTYLGIEQAARIERFHVCGLEQFHPEPSKYDCIWLQWCTGYLTDNDFVDFLKRIKTSLTKHGMCVIKDNITKIEADFDNTDSSFTRTRQNLKDCIHKARMRIVVDEKQYGFPAELYEVRMLAFK
jgi:protein N-terminal methyltransferase